MPKYSFPIYIMIVVSPRQTINSCFFGGEEDIMIEETVTVEVTCKLEAQEK